MEAVLEKPQINILKGGIVLNLKALAKLKLGKRCPEWKPNQRKATFARLDAHKKTSVDTDPITGVSRESTYWLITGGWGTIECRGIDNIDGEPITYLVPENAGEPPEMRGDMPIYNVKLLEILPKKIKARGRYVSNTFDVFDEATYYFLMLHKINQINVKSGKGIFELFDANAEYEKREAERDSIQNAQDRLAAIFGQNPANMRILARYYGIALTSGDQKLNDKTLRYQILDRFHTGLHGKGKINVDRFMQYTEDRVFRNLKLIQQAIDREVVKFDQPTATWYLMHYNERKQVERREILGTYQALLHQGDDMAPIVDFLEKEDNQETLNRIAKMADFNLFPASPVEDIKAIGVMIQKEKEEKAILTTPTEEELRVAELRNLAASQDPPIDLGSRSSVKSIEKYLREQGAL